MNTIFEDLLTFENSSEGWGEWVGAPFHKAPFLNQLTFACSKLTMETLEEGVKYVLS